jgi:hypothetical protein
MSHRQPWTLTRHSPTEQTYESQPYSTEVIPSEDKISAQDQLRHAQEQLIISRKYPRQDRVKP